MKWLCELVLSLSYFGCGVTISPCPGIFDFFTNDEQKVYGRIALQSFQSVSTLALKIIFTIRGLENNGYLGEIKATNDVLASYNKGETVYIRVYFPVGSHLPKVTKITVNDQIICSGPGDELSTAVVNTVTLGQRYGHRTVIQNSGVKVPPVERPNPQLYTEPVRNRFSEITTDDYDCGVTATDDDRLLSLINNGQFYKRGELPWLVAIYKIVNLNLNFICGGTLVSDRHVITAAHCLHQTSLLPISEIVVRVGAHSLNLWGDDYSATRNLKAANIHEQYNPITLQNDILVLTLDKEITFNKFSRPACLWSGDTELSQVVGATGIVAGWGFRAVGDTKLQYEPEMVHVPIVSNIECKASKSAFHEITSENTLCAGERRGAGPCNGDSGGGLYLPKGGKWRLRGLVSTSLKRNGLGICNLNEYVVYTDTAQFLPWIRNIISLK